MNRYILAGSLMLFGITAFGQPKAPSPRTWVQADTRPSTAKWKVVAIDRDAMGNDSRIFEIELNSIKVNTTAVSVHVRITSNSIGTTGYNCSPGELRHQKIEKAIAELICNRESSPHPYSRHERDWKLVRSTKAANGNIMSMYFDLNGINRINDTAMVTTRNSDTSLDTFQFDCKGYYKDRGEWRTLDLTDHISTVPRGYISPERKAEREVCANGPR